MEKQHKVLVSGASFAGLTTAYRMQKMGYDVTVVETGDSLKRGGTPVDIKGPTVDIMKRMGLFEQIRAQRLSLEKWEFKNADDLTENTLLLRQPGEALPEDEFEIERDVLLDMLYGLVKDDVTFIFSNSIASLQETEDGVTTTFKDGSQRSYAFVFGCDGLHSTVRRIFFGPEEEYVHFLGPYFSIAIVNKLLVTERTLQLYAEPNKGIMLNAYNGKTDVVFTFRPEAEINYDFRNQEQQRAIVAAQLEGMGWRAAELQMELLKSSSFYFDKFCQVKMPAWSKGRVALVGDAAYCASPAAGMGGSLAIIGAFALADAIEKHKGDIGEAFAAYQRDLLPFIEVVQAEAVETLDKLLPRTEEEIRWRNKNGF